MMTMNNVVLNGYVAEQGQYVSNTELDQFEYRFFLKVNSTLTNSVSAIPCKCVGWLASQAYANLCENCYVELNGEIVREKDNKVFVLVTSMVSKKPKKKRQYYIKTTEFFKLYNPKNVLERVGITDDEEAKK